MRKSSEKPPCVFCSSRHQSAFCDFENLSYEELDQKKVCYTFKKGENIFHEGGFPHGVYCVSKGKIKLYKTGIDGRDQIIRFAKSGDLIGYRALLSGEPYSSSAACLEETEVCFIPKEVILRLLRSEATFSMVLMRRACHELGEAARIITNMAQKSVKERVAEILLLLRQDFGTDSDNAVDVRLTRDDLASLVGTATESLIRILSDLKAEGLIDTPGKKIVLKNIKALAQLGRVEDVVSPA
ncbi:MAG: Crp/Fnr family transcriptional regulator [Flavobacteriales bacterium]|nr:Crp/Fnr family transcriptional regulator [Flavobacteriales bacterium]MCX7649695.1 Crp/Fnr family transcriptional regulator [Flavobacteriales bacterium]MDW8432881.1 Crp/Fnr family transcriptional regulator [Flavobacteriales bacterium]